MTHDIEIKNSRSAKKVVVVARTEKILLAVLDMISGDDYYFRYYDPKRRRIYLASEPESEVSRIVEQAFGVYSVGIR